MSSEFPPTMKDVAALAGVARSTVSMALRDDPSIPPATRERIRKAAQELGYKPHPLVSALMTTRRKRGPIGFKAVLAYVVTHKKDDDWRANPVFARFHEGALRRAEELGFRLEEFPVHSQGMSARRYADILRARGINGLLIAPLPHDERTLAIDVTDFAVVGIGLSVATPTIERISNDHFQSMSLAMERCRALGYRRIGFVASQATNQRLGHRWLAAFEHEQRQHPDLPALPALLPPDEKDIEGALAMWCATEQPEVVIFGVFNTSRPFALPDGIGIVTLAVSEPEGPYTGIHQNDRQLAAIAVDHLVLRLNRNRLGPDLIPQIQLLGGEWVPGQSAPGPQAPATVSSTGLRGRTRTGKAVKSIR